MAAGTRTVYALDLDDIIPFPDSAHASFQIPQLALPANEPKDTRSTSQARRELDDSNRGKRTHHKSRFQHVHNRCETSCRS